MLAAARLSNSLAIANCRLSPDSILCNANFYFAGALKAINPSQTNSLRYKLGHSIRKHLLTADLAVP